MDSAAVASGTTAWSDSIGAAAGAFLAAGVFVAFFDSTFFFGAAALFFDGFTFLAASFSGLTSSTGAASAY